MSPSTIVLIAAVLLLGLLVQLYMMRKNKRGVEAFLAKHPDAVRVRLASSLVDSIITGSVSVDAVDEGETPVLTNDGLKVDTPHLGATDLAQLVLLLGLEVERGDARRHSDTSPAAMACFRAAALMAWR